MSVKPGGRLVCQLTCAAVMLAGLVGCGSGSSAPKTLPTLPSTAPPTSADPTPSPTSTSKKAELAAATAVVKRYYRVANDLRHHMDAPALAALMTRDCPCQAQVNAVRRAARKGEHYIDHAQVLHIVPSYEGPSAAFVLVEINASRGGLETADGNIVTSAPPAKHIRRVFRLEKIQTRWLITRIEALK